MADASAPDAGRDAGPRPVDAGPPPPARCDDIPSVPVAFTTLSGPVAGEDFAFDRTGGLIGTDESGNILRSEMSGSPRVVVPRAAGEGGEIAGMRFLHDGTLVYASVSEQAIWRADLATGERRQVLGGLAYPNGIEIGDDNFIYVAEQDAGQVRRVNPDNGEFTILATDIAAPNGITFGPRYEHLYVGSFGTGRVYRMRIDENGARVGDVTLFATVPGAPDEGTGEPQWLREIDWDEAYSWTAAQWRAFFASRPEAMVPAESSEWTAEQWVSWVESRLGGGFGEAGGLDGMAADACGYIFVTEFVRGVVWRISPDGSRVEQLFDPPTEWVPNIQWGSGVGGWNPLHMYVIDREPEKVYVLEYGIPGKRRVHP